MPTNEGFSGVSNCYVFKSRLQEYAQKKGLATPVYETIKEGPSHEPFFRSTVIVNEARYVSLPGFYNRKAAEQSAAEVALQELSKCDEVDHTISQPVNETGLCKNLLQEYAQKKNYAIPVYQCQNIESPGRATLFQCNVDIGGIQYIGASAGTKKEAEIKAARTALLAMQSSGSESSNNTTGMCQLTVIPFRKRVPETAPILEEAARLPKAKKARVKRKTFKKKFPRDRVNHKHGESAVDPSVITIGQPRSESDHTGISVVQGTSGRIVPESSQRETTEATGALTFHLSSDFTNGVSTTMAFDQHNCVMPSGVACEPNADAAMISGASPASEIGLGTSTGRAGLNPMGEEWKLVQPMNSI
ncbi:double-stranded RNA-binding protein 1-like [Mercurialis annua]|uniref:double-stranded RNA-binding protein 1-like n=1 Tax=Mercurialis annua TaxID=3986 RepID=UPI00215DF0B4|nr:double-stranded RNA-binding protein 1-like [Mercurialis annua]